MLPILFYHHHRSTLFIHLSEVINVAVLCPDSRICPERSFIWHFLLGFCHLTLYFTLSSKLVHSENKFSVSFIASFLLGVHLP